MSRRALQPAAPQTSWVWPFQRKRYDRALPLSEAERDQLDRIVRQHLHIRGKTRRALHRLYLPLIDVGTYLHAPQAVTSQMIRFLFIEMYHRGKTFWAWSAEEWRESIGQTPRTFAERYGLSPQRKNHARLLFVAVAYLLCPHISIDGLLLVAPALLATRIFGREAITTAVGRIRAVLQGWGYRQQGEAQLITSVSYLLLKNRSPVLDHLTIELLEAADQDCPLTVRRYFFQVSRALHALGIVPRALPGPGFPAKTYRTSDESLPKEWLDWCDRWRKQTTLQRPENVYYSLLMTGRWLKISHPEVASPAQWTYDLAAEFVAAVSQVRIGEWANPALRERRTSAQRLGQAFRPHARNRLLGSMRAFLRDCQEWGWIPVHLNPDRALRTPSSIRRLMGPSPRVISKELWAKVLWAAMNLQVEDLPVWGNGNDLPPYPIEMVRAIAVVWCFTALRSDEIRRLRVGCIRWQYEDVMIPETGEILPRDATCFLDVPINKTMSAYTKPVHPLVGKRINEWEQVRPHAQPREADQKTSETVQFLFFLRGVRISKAYINDSLIPMLCHKAGVPLEDSRGKITSHRARATIASMLYNAKEPLSIFELKEYLGHKYLSSTQSYLQVDPTKLASKVAKAGYLEQNLATIEVLLDQEAVLSGAAARGECWKYYDLGHGWCTNPFWSACAHRLACAKCPYYRPKDSLQDQLVEGKANLVRMLEFVQLTEEEKLLVTEGIELHQELIEKLADVPTPAGPTPRELENNRSPETKVIPLQTIRRNKKQHQVEP
jgi:integrase